MIQKRRSEARQLYFVALLYCTLAASSAFAYPIREASIFESTTVAINSPHPRIFTPHQLGNTQYRLKKIPSKETNGTPYYEYKIDLGDIREAQRRTKELGRQEAAEQEIERHFLFQGYNPGSQVDNFN